jgi:hypothetical protein
MPCCEDYPCCGHGPEPTSNEYEHYVHYEDELYEDELYEDEHYHYEPSHDVAYEDKAYYDKYEDDYDQY